MNRKIKLIVLFICLITTHILKAEIPVIRVSVNSFDSSKYRGIIYKKNGHIINEINLEEYLYSVLGGEISYSYDIEAIKAQAIAARTYALYNMNLSKNKDFDIYAEKNFQTYKGVKVENPIFKQAVDETKGMVITYNGEIINAMFHSSSGDKTNSAKEYYGFDRPYLQSVEDYVPESAWEFRINSKKYNNKISKNDSKRRIREKLNLKSSNFNMYNDGEDIVIVGMGYGHGVGLSQKGANNLAKRGYDYEYILKHYYTGVDIEKIY